VPSGIDALIVAFVVAMMLVLGWRLGLQLIVTCLLALMIFGLLTLLGLLRW
jgi:hypothetical protein